MYPSVLAVLFWPGSEGAIGGIRPSIQFVYNHTFPYDDRISLAVHWLKDLDKDLVAIYFDEPDSTGHKYGPRSDQLKAKVSEIQTK